MANCAACRVSFRTVIRFHTYRLTGLTEVGLQYVWNQEVSDTEKQNGSFQRQVLQDPSSGTNNA